MRSTLVRQVTYTYRRMLSYKNMYVSYSMNAPWRTDRQTGDSI